MQHGGRELALLLRRRLRLAVARGAETGDEDQGEET